MISGAVLVETGTPFAAGALPGTNASFRKTKPRKQFCIWFSLLKFLRKTSVATKRNVPGSGLCGRQDCLCWAEGLTCLLAQVGLNAFGRARFSSLAIEIGIQVRQLKYGGSTWTQVWHY